MIGVERSAAGPGRMRFNATLVGGTPLACRDIREQRELPAAVNVNVNVNADENAASSADT
ncbi:hypothetical protein [Burkholderia sp. IMCC1007]|uniref:hypothetical protein n=1 Tax=Burkholderia sp. IMCC1007 TaxID=3004104 RepID=UPI0022B4B717|nr:hypothetical protein [Burkholderia sp. IMCC1007]